MNKGILHKYRLIAIGLMLAFSSCAKNQLYQDSQITTGNPVEMRLTVGAPMSSAASNNETDINRLRVVVFGSTTAPDAGKLIMNKFYATAPAGNSFKEIITSGKRDIYIIVNEPLTRDGKELDIYKNISKVDDIRSLSLEYSIAAGTQVYTPGEIPMFVRHIDKQISIDSPNEISGSVERVMAKVTMKLNIAHSNFTPTGKHVVIDNITIKNLPEESYLIAQKYSDIDPLVTSEKQTVSAITAGSGYNFSSDNTFYVPEYILSNPDKRAYIEILGHVNGEPTRVCKYIVALGDAMDDGRRYGNEYNITRNRHYEFVGNVKSYGELNDLAVQVTVKPWNTVDMGEEVGHYVAFSKVTNVSGAPIADGSNLNAMGATIKVLCKTNIGGWYVIVRNAQGAVVHTTAPTAAVTSSTDQTVDVVVPGVSTTDSPRRTVEIYHPIVANELIGPVRSLNFTQNPNSEYVIVNGIRWATGNLVSIPYTNTMKIGEFDDDGAYFQFGSLVGWPGGATGFGNGTGFPNVNDHIFLPKEYAWYSTGRDWLSAGRYLGDHGPLLPDIDDVTKGSGDPCYYYLGDKWRLPTKEEFVKLKNSGSTWVLSPAKGRFFGSSSQLFLPGIDIRNSSDGSFNDYTTLGGYWSKSIQNTGAVSSNVFALTFDQNQVSPNNSTFGRRTGLHVRCVKIVD